MNNYEIASACLALPLYIPFCILVARKTVRLSFATWILWGCIEILLITSLFLNGGSYLLPAAYTIGSCTVAGFVLHYGSSPWTRFETKVSVLAAFCMGIRYVGTPDMAVIASSLALLVAAYPTMRDAYRKPENEPCLLWTGFLIANALGVAGGDSWTIKERFFPSVSLLGSVIIVVLSARPYFRSSPVVVVVFDDLDDT